MKETYTIDSYSVSLGKLGYRTSDNVVIDIGAGIRCRNKTTKGAFLDIVFVPEGIPLPPNESSNTYLFNTIYRPQLEYIYYLDILRNENPVFMDIDKDNPDRHKIHTGHEEVGDGENTL